MSQRIKAPQREDLAKIFKDPRTLKAFELMFSILPDELDFQQSKLDDLQALAESNAAQTALAIALLHAIQALADIKAVEPTHQCACQFDDLSPRNEFVSQDAIAPRYESEASESVEPRYEITQANCLEPIKIESCNFSALEII